MTPTVCKRGHALTPENTKVFPHGRRDLVGACPIATLPPYPFEIGLDDRVLHDDRQVADVLADSLAHESHRVSGGLSGPGPIDLGWRRETPTGG
ncbi:MAG: hypothetical protein IMZ46_04950, partial [Acidobacteria bacterium]|nr:hypothetical protein [Acidobacteriota bacterium]